MRCIVKLQIGKDTYYLESLFPCKWSYFISSAKLFESVEQARDELRSRHYQLMNSLGDSEEALKSAVIDCYEDGVLKETVKYL